MAVPTRLLPDLSMLKSAPVVLLNMESIKGERNQETSVGMEKGGRRVYIVGFCRCSCRFAHSHFRPVCQKSPFESQSRKHDSECYCYFVPSGMYPRDVINKVGIHASQFVKNRPLLLLLLFCPLPFSSGLSKIDL